MKSNKYLSDERFARMEESFNEALQHVRVESYDFRVTVLPAQPKLIKKSDLLRLRKQTS